MGSNNIKIVLTKIGKEYINKQLKGPSISLIGFIPFNCDEEFLNANSNKSTLISYAMSEGLYGNYFFNGINYIKEYNGVKVKDENEYINLFDLITYNRLFGIKYTNTHNDNNESISFYNFNLNIDNINIEFGGENHNFYINGLAIFIQSNICNGKATNNDIELFGIIYFDEEIDLVKNDINWTMYFNDEGIIDYNEVKNETLYDFNDLDVTEKSNVYSASEFNITNTPYTFSDNFHDNAKTLYYENGWVLGFVKGDLNNYQYDLTLINDSANENAFFFNINPNANSLEIQNTNRDSNIIFGNVSYDLSSKNAFIIDSNQISAKDSFGIFNVKSNSDILSSNYIFDVGSGNGNKIVESNNITVFGENNKIYSSNNIFVKGNLNYVSGDNDYIVGDKNFIFNNDVYVFGNSLSSNVKDSINLGHDYFNKDYSFVYSNGNKVYGFVNDFGNFVINSTSNGSNIQFSKDSIYLMNTFKKIDPSSSKNSLLINTTNVSSENSIVYGDYKNFENSYILNSLSVPSSKNTTNSIIIDRVNSNIENSLDLSNKVYNVTSINSIINGDTVSSRSGVNIKNSLVGDLYTQSGYINNSIVLSANVSGESKIDNSLVLINDSKNVTSGYISNSIIQGNTRNSTFINSHLIGNLPINVNKKFEDCLVVSNGNEYVEIYADKIVKIIDDEEVSIPLKYGLLDTYMDESCARGKEWKTDDIEETYEDKIKNLLKNQKIFYKNANYQELIFAGELPENVNKCYCSFYIVTKELDFILECYIDCDAYEATIDIQECTIPKKNKNVSYADLEEIYENFIISVLNSKIYIISHFNEENIFVLNRFSTCNIINEDTIPMHSTRLYTKLKSREVYTEKVISSIAMQNDTTYNFSGNSVSAKFTVKFNTQTSLGNSAEINIFNCIDNELYKKITGVKNDISQDLKDCSALGLYASEYFKPYITYYDDTKYNFDSFFPYVFSCDDKGDITYSDYIENNYVETLNNTSKNKLIPITGGINTDFYTNFNGYQVDRLLYDFNDYESKNLTAFQGSIPYLNVPGNFSIDYGKDFVTFKLKGKTFDIDNTYEAISPHEDIEKYITPESNVTNFTKCIIWGLMSNVEIFMSTFNIKSDVSNECFTVSNKQIPILKFHQSIHPNIDILSFIVYSNPCQLYPFDSSSYNLDKYGVLYLNLYKKSSTDSLFKGTGMFSYIKYPQNYVNPFVNGQSSGLFRHELTYIIGGTPYINGLTNNLYNTYKSEIGKISNAGVIRLGHYDYI